MMPQPLHTQSTTTPVKNTQTQQLQVGDHIYIKNKIHTLTDPTQMIGLVSSQA